MQLTTDAHLLLALQRVSGCVALSLLLHLIVLQVVPGDFFPSGKVSQLGGKQQFLARISGEQAAIGESHQKVSEAELSGPETATRNPPGSVAGASATEQKSAPLPPSHLGLFEGPWYYSARYLHRRPEPMQAIRPAYPLVSDQQLRTIRLLLFISKEGSVDSYRLVNADGDDPYAIAVINAFTQARFTPGIIADMPVKSQLLAEVYFDPGNPTRVDLTATPALAPVGAETKP